MTHEKNETYVSVTLWKCGLGAHGHSHWIWATSVLKQQH